MSKNITTEEFYDKYYIEENLGNGDCLPRSFADALFANPAMHVLVRAYLKKFYATPEYVKDEKYGKDVMDLLRVSILNDDDEPNGKRKHSEIVGQRGEYCSLTDVTILGMIFCVTVFLHSPTTDSNEIYTQVYKVQDSICDIHIYYFDEHFEAVFPRFSFDHRLIGKEAIFQDSLNGEKFFGKITHFDLSEESQFRFMYVASASTSEKGLTEYEIKTALSKKYDFVGKYIEWTKRVPEKSTERKNGKY